MLGKIFPGNHCKHQWNLLINKEIQSPYEQLIAQGENITTMMPGHWGIELFRKTAIVILVCDHCGEVNKSVVSSVGRHMD